MAADVLFLEYPKYSTCQKAKKWLDAHGVTYADRHIVEDNPTADELRSWPPLGPSRPWPPPWSTSYRR
ncbi:hypothetical protein NE591_14265 [Adlercreutzia sp. DFI.6.23]|nr:hypothetical protein [Adlercreutzia sp. DFI.6.23]